MKYVTIRISARDYDDTDAENIVDHFVMSGIGEHFDYEILEETMNDQQQETIEALREKIREMDVELDDAYQGLEFISENLILMDAKVFNDAFKGAKSAVTFINLMAKLSEKHQERVSAKRKNQAVAAKPSQGENKTSSSALSGESSNKSKPPPPSTGP